jgi:glycosyltransferase involved in cell wall biosynthesis
MVDLYYGKKTPDDSKLFNQNTRLFCYSKPTGIKNKIVKHTLFYNEYNFLINEVLQKQTAYDYIWANDLPVLKPAILLKNHFKAQVIYDSHEIYIETLNQFFPTQANGLKKFVFQSLLSFMRYFGSKAEKKMISEVDQFVTVSESVKLFFEKKFFRKDILVVYNCPPLQHSEEKIDLKAQLKLDKNCFVLLYQGVMNPGRALDKMIEAQLYTDENIRFVLMGDGNIKKDLIEQTKRLELDEKIIFIDRVHPAVLLNYTRGADAGIIFQETEKNESKNLGIANKFFEYIHAGVPFVATDAPENRLISKKYPVCLFVGKQHDVKEIANKIDQLQRISANEFKNAAIEAAKEYNWEAQAEKIRKIVM